MDPFVIGLPLYFAAHFGLTPLLGISSKKISPQVDHVPIEPGEFPAQLAVYFETQASALEQLGFHRVAYYRMPKSSPGCSYCILMLNRATGDGAMVTAIMQVAAGVESIATQYVEFSTRYPDGRTFDTLNGSSLSIFARVASETKTRVPSVTDPRQLHALHRFVMARTNVGGQPVTFDQSTAADHLNAERRQTLTAQVRSGRFYWNEADDTYRRTIKGAYLMTWSLMWPISIFRRWAMERRAAKILREFYAVCPTVPPPVPA